MTPDLSYSWAQALNDLGQVSAITALIGFMLFAIVAELALPRSRRDGVVAMVAVTGFAYSLGTAGYRWINGLGGPAYHGYATGDSFALFFEILFAILGILTVAVSHPYLQKRGLREGEFHILIMAAVIGMMVLGSATSLVTVFLGLELFSIALYIACGFIRNDSRSQEAAAKYLLVGGFASAFVLYGMALIYGASGTTLLPDIATRLSASAAGNPLLVLGIVLMGVGFAFKVSAAPFHMWTPDVYQGAPIPVTAFMSVGTKAAAFAMIVRVFASTTALRRIASAMERGAGETTSSRGAPGFGSPGQANARACLEPARRSSGRAAHGAAGHRRRWPDRPPARTCEPHRAARSARARTIPQASRPRRRQVRRFRPARRTRG